MVRNKQKVTGCGFTPLESPVIKKGDDREITNKVLIPYPVRNDVSRRDISNGAYRKDEVKALSFLTGFTLVELMIASALLVSILGAFLLSFNSTLKNTNYSQGFALARRACQSKLEEMIGHNFDSIIQDYGAGGSPGNTFAFNTSELTGMGNINITSREDLYEGGEHLAIEHANWIQREGHTSLVYDDKMWVIGGTGTGGDEVWKSIDGVNWTNATLNAAWLLRNGHTSLIYDNRMWVMGGIDNNGVYKNDVWYSADGANWINATNSASWSPRYGLTSLIYDNKMWVMGGRDENSVYKNDVWYSTDGVNWNPATANANWAPRRLNTCVVYNGSMWVIGGRGGTYKNDVWYSNNGINWNCATANASWLVREKHTSVIYDNKMWVMGGTDGAIYKNDIWYSTNGINWTCANANAGWDPRRQATSVVYDGKMWVIGGGNATTWVNDIWYSAGYNRLLEVFITASWRHYDGRSFGEDTNLNGTLDAGEDLDNDGLLDSPVQLRAFLSDKGTTGVYLGKSP